MWKIIPFSVLQCAFLSGGQVMLKFALDKMGDFSWNKAFWVGLFTNWWFMACGVCYGMASLLWMYLLKNFPFSMAYPMISISYVFGMLAAIVFFHEQVPLYRWAGVLLIVAGCCLIVK